MNIPLLHVCEKWWSEEGPRIFPAMSLPKHPPFRREVILRSVSAFFGVYRLHNHRQGARRFCMQGRSYQHRNRRESRILLFFYEKLPALHAWHAQIENDQCWRCFTEISRAWTPSPACSTEKPWCSIMAARGSRVSASSSTRRIVQVESIRVPVRSGSDRLTKKRCGEAGHFPSSGCGSLNIIWRAQ